MVGVFVRTEYRETGTTSIFPIHAKWPTATTAAGQSSARYSKRDSPAFEQEMAALAGVDQPRTRNAPALASPRV